MPRIWLATRLRIQTANSFEATLLTAVTENLAGFPRVEPGTRHVQDAARVADGTSCTAGGIGYTKEPKECVNYVSAHDNETLFDMCVLKMPQVRSECGMPSSLVPCLGRWLSYPHDRPDLSCKLMATKVTDEWHRPIP